MSGNDKNQVEVIVEANNKLKLVFPEEVNARIRSRVNVDDLLKILSADEDDDVEGQSYCDRYTVSMGVRG